MAANPTAKSHSSPKKGTKTLLTLVALARSNCIAVSASSKNCHPLLCGFTNQPAVRPGPHHDLLHLSTTPSSITSLRGGGVQRNTPMSGKGIQPSREHDQEDKKKIVKKTNKKKKSKKVATETENDKRNPSRQSTSTQKKGLNKDRTEIELALKANATAMLGDAIRERADHLLSSPPSCSERRKPLLDQIDQAVDSVGWALGASDQLESLVAQPQRTGLNNNEGVDEETGSVEASTTSVFVHYFLRSHGGAHAVQSACSLLATLTGVGAMLLPLLPPTKKDVTSLPVSEATLGLIRRCLIFAMMKHISGMLAAGALVARAIPEVGLRNARGWIQGLVQDPVSQYVFYGACVSFWLPTAAAAAAQPRWWQAFSSVPLLLVGPIVFRELVNTVFVISDVMVLWRCSNQSDKREGQASTVLQRILELTKTTLDALMSIIVSSKVWRSADAIQRQAILAKLVGRTSLVGEVLVGLFMSIDAITLLFFALYPTKSRLPFGSVLKSCLCAQLYLRFLLVRRRKISRLATKIRGGAARFPLYVLDVLLDPATAMGLTNEQKTKQSLKESPAPKWKSWLLTSLGLEEVRENGT